MKGIIGRKIGMTQIFDEEGRVIPVTVIEAGPCWVVQVKSKQKDGYEAVQLGFQEIKKEKNIPKPLLGIFKKAGVPPCRVLREFKMTGYKVGDKVTVEIFAKGDIVNVTGISKGKGFQGVMKRHNFAGGPDSHGSMFNRAPGSIGSSSFPSRVWKGKRMAGHMGNERVTVRNLKIVDVIPEQNILLVKGAVPGGENGILQIWKVEA
ncbi:MAG: 50S ribosomal protein L3 [Thermodesulfovibrio sp.]|nr:50S ribosomal protein L3 [Thermodesulfovibrio sp.]MCX7725083.1 50S ribosomal protein L3 [Thermodesulfovibrio sp.]MDW7998310.1 50S ribosomal protein L3 [Thermodesulfovibrio sp.]